MDATASDGLFAVPPKTVADLDECFFYHSMDLPRSGAVTGAWDLRVNVDEHLGHTDFDGRRVLEIGPASGYLTFEMERRGARVVSVELAPDAEADILPGWWVDAAAYKAENRSHGAAVRNSYWLAHEEFGSRAKIHYGNAHLLPDELGRFDIVIISCVLLHVRDPIGLVTECARFADQRMIVADLLYDHLHGPVMELLPSSENLVFHTWWRFSPDFFVQLLDTLGFRQTGMMRYEQRLEMADQMHELFTVTGDRT
jgi:O-methyltransferase